MVSKISKGRKLLFGAGVAVLVTVLVLVLVNRTKSADYEQKVALAKSYGFPFEGRDLKDNGGTTRDEDKDAYDEVVVFPPILEPFEEIDYGVLPMPPSAVINP